MEDTCRALFATIDECPKCGGVHFIQVFELDEPLVIDGDVYAIAGTCPLSDVLVVLTVEE
jgi:hypothetical protein